VASAESGEVVSLAVRLYRKLPRSARNRLLAAVPVSRQLRLARRLVRWPGDQRVGALGSVRHVRDDGQRVEAVVTDDASPLSVARANRDAVMALLERARIPYFVLPSVGLCPVVGILAEHRATVLALLRAEQAERHAQVLVARRRRADRRGPKNDPDRPAPNVRTANGSTLRVSYPVTDPRGRWVLGNTYACVVEFWRPRPGDRIGPEGGDVALTSVPAGDPLVGVPERMLTRFVTTGSDPRLFPTPAALAMTPIEHVDFPIDAVFTWVDGSDPIWVRRMAEALAGGAPLHETATSASRFVSRDELRYSLRSVASFAPWIRHIYLVTADQIPSWLIADHPMVTVVSHRELFGSRGVLPTFNSHAIESQLHHIAGLSEHFIYFNDDMFLGRPVEPNLFFHANGIAKYFQSSAEIGYGPPTIADAPVNAAAKNNRQILSERFGRFITTKMRHVPYPLRRSVLAEIEETLADVVAATAAHQFRHQDDISIPSSLHHYWAYLTGRSVPGRISYNYIDIGHPWAPVAMSTMLRRRSNDVFCINDTDHAPDAVAEQEALVARFLPAYFPFRAPFERDNGTDNMIGQATRERSESLTRASR
jgi:hypothetical protein